ncbi:MAG: HypC/HybG/HupF family hydrogenase formation chaperone [Pyrinomonadaceae bacterium]
MCLAVPGKVVGLHKVNEIQMGKVDFDGITKDICLAYVPDITIGEYVIVHVGFAIERLDEKSALETLRLFRLMGGLEEELGILEGESNEVSARVS